MVSTTSHHHQNGNSIHRFQRTTAGIAEIHRVRLVRQTAFGQDVATQVATKVIMAMGQNVATKKITAMGQDGATKVEPAIRGLGAAAHGGVHRGLGQRRHRVSHRASTTTNGKEVTRQLETTIGNEKRSLAQGHLHDPAPRVKSGSYQSLTRFWNCAVGIALLYARFVHTRH